MARAKRLPGGPVAALLAAVALTVVSLAVGIATATGGPAAALSTAKAGTCQVPAGASEVTATPVPGSTSDWNLTSFDGTIIRLHWFPVAGATAAHPAPTILMGPGWGEAGDTDTTGTSSGLFDFVTIRQLWNNGYNVLTWDPRGLGQSGGSAEVDSPAVEGRDMERIISWVATRPGVQLDRPGEPRLGMVGVSYGAGIQLTTAAVDCRVDAIVPTWSWHSLATSLDKGNITKNGWSGLLYAALAGSPIDPHLVVAHQDPARPVSSIQPSAPGSCGTRYRPTGGPDPSAHPLRPGGGGRPVHVGRGDHQLRQSCGANDVPTAMVWCPGDMIYA